MYPTARFSQPSKLLASSPSPPPFKLNPEAAAFVPSVPVRQTTLGWPPNQSPLSDKERNHLHPSEIPDLVFLKEHSTSWLDLANPFAGNRFQPSFIPWWTHWFIAFAHEKTKLDGAAITQRYKHRYRDVIPGIQLMETADELLLYTHLCDGGHEYASQYVTFPPLYPHLLLKTAVGIFPFSRPVL